MYKPGDVIDQYRLTGELGAGAYGVVYAAVNTVSDQPVALKLVPLCGRAGKRELNALRQYHDLDHPNLLKVHHSGICGDFLYYTMDLAEGTLAAQHLDSAALLASAVRVAGALAELHASGLLHRDVKPDNLFWRSGEPLLGDVGLVTGREGASLSGTPGFLPPEVRSGAASLTEYADVYALAKSFYCLLAGKSAGEYPQYNGPFDPAAAHLLQVVLAVCDEPPRIVSAAGFRDALQTPLQRKKKWRLTTGILAGAAMLTAAFLFLRHGAASASPSAEKQPFRDPMVTAVLRAAAGPGPAEKRAMERQKTVWRQLQKEAQQQMILRYPPRRITSMDYEVRRGHFKKQFLEETVRKRAQEDPEFQCFYVLSNEVRELFEPLQELPDHPELAEKLTEPFLRWQKKYAEYCRERDRLLK